MIKLAPSTPELRERQSESLCMCEGRLGLGTERGGLFGDRVSSMIPPGVSRYLVFDFRKEARG